MRAPPMSKEAVAIRRVLAAAGPTSCARYHDTRPRCRSVASSAHTSSLVRDKQASDRAI